MESIHKSIANNSGLFFEVFTKEVSNEEKKTELMEVLRNISANDQKYLRPLRK